MSGHLSWRMKWITLLFVCLCSGIQCNLLPRIFKMALKRSFQEQDVEDINALHKVDNHLVRRLIAMPLTDDFRPNQADFMHGKIQYGDKCSLPNSIGRLLFEKKYEVPWLFEIKPVRSSGDRQFTVKSPLSVDQSDGYPKVSLKKAYLGALDFRSPDNYIFLPKWLMKDLNLEPSDLVDISFIRMRLADLVVILPVTASWDKLYKKLGNGTKARLEQELNKYTALTAGSTILIEIDGEEYPLFVKQTIAEGGLSVDGVRVQDSDLRVDISREILDKVSDEL